MKASDSDPTGAGAGSDVWALGYAVRMTDILETHPLRDTFDPGPLRTAIDAALRCASTCASCADACLHGEDANDMARCIDLDEQCATICFTTARVLSQPGPNGDSWRSIVQACIDVCRECAEECGGHDHEHCRICAAACRECADACQALLDAAS